MNILILGLGSIGRRHARCFRTLGVDRITGFDPDPERRAQFAREIQGETFALHNEALATKPDLAVVASPNIYHLPQARMLVAAGIPMLIEKPLGTDLELAAQLADAIRAGGLYTHVGSNWKFHPAFQTMKAWIEQGRIGIPTGLQVLAGQWLPDWHPYEDYRRMYAARTDLGGGAIFDTHELIYMQWLLGPICQFGGLKAQSGVLAIQTEDVAVAALRFESGALGCLLTDYIQRFPTRRYHISGSEGTIEWDNAEGKVVLHLPGRRAAEGVDVHVTDNNAMYLAQAARVLEDLRWQREPVTSVAEMLRVLDLQLLWHRQELAECR